MKKLNYNHLYYFYEVAEAGSIARAADKLHVTPQTISGQISAMEQYLGIALFDRVGKRLILNQAGETAHGYAQTIFGMGNELLSVITNKNISQPLFFKVGVIDIVPKVLAFDLLKQCFKIDNAVKLIAKEGDLETLLADLALNRIDLILSDRPVPPGVNIKCYSHFLGESSLTFFAKPQEVERYRDNFPESLDGAPFLMPGDKSAQKNNLLSWFEQQQIQPRIVGEFDDSALMKLFGQEGYGVFCAPSGTEEFVLEQFDVAIIARLDQVKEHFYAITTERKIHHPAIGALIEEAKRILNHNEPA